MPDVLLIALGGDVDAGTDNSLQMCVRIEMGSYAAAPQLGRELDAVSAVHFARKLKRRAFRIDDQPVEVENQGTQA